MYIKILAECEKERVGERKIGGTSPPNAFKESLNRRNEEAEIVRRAGRCRCRK